MNIDNHSISLLSDCRIIELSRHRHENWALSVVENSAEFPFKVKRVFYLYDVPGDSSRGGHSHYNGEELIIAVSGSFDVTLTDGHEKQVFSLNRPYKALYIPAGIWRSIDNFSSGSVCLVLTSELYSEDDYVRDFAKFKELSFAKIKIK